MISDLIGLVKQMQYTHAETRVLIQSLELIIAGVRATTFVFIIFSIIFF